MKHGKTYYVCFILAVLTLVVTAIVYVAPHAKSPKELVIADVRPNSPRIVKDDGTIEFADNLKIRNLTDHPYDLTGLFLSDKRGDLQKLPLDGVVIEPFGYVMIKLDPSWNFGLHREGDEDIYLSDSRGNVIFQYRPSMKPEKPVLSVKSGFYDSEFDLTISSDSKYKVLYTLDGSDPSETGILYTGPIHVYDRSSEPNMVVSIPNVVKDYLEEDTDEHDPEHPKAYWHIVDDPVDKAFIVRAVAMDDYGNSSEIVTNEYFFCGDKYDKVLSIIADTYDLFGDYGILSTGIGYDKWYLEDQEAEYDDPNYMKKGREWEIPAAINLFYNENSVLSGTYGLRLQGRTTRERRIKNFQLFARNSYNGSDVFPYQFFDGEDYLPDRITLDDSFRESLFLDLIKDEEIIKQHTTGRVALFINGEFYNNVYIRQKIDEKYFFDHFGIPEDNLLVLSESFGEIGVDDDAALEEARNWYLDIDEFAKENDLNDPDNYSKLQTMIDMDSYLDYFSINTWVGCADWAEYENDTYWRAKIPYDNHYGDGRFRWIIHDGDNVFNDQITWEQEWFSESGDLVNGLLNSSLFRADLAKRIEELGQTSFSDQNIKQVLHSGKWDDPRLPEIESFLLNRKIRMAEAINELRR
ncbi:MAG: CotH kinase family protein [Lachnospiraceae bacterium]|nr:CotH kinase family protein [Lachnospiraceae bacterium]